MEPGPHVEEMEAAIRADGEGLRALLDGDEERGRERLAEAVARYRASWELAPPRSYGRLVGMLKAAVIAGDAAEAAAYAREAVPEADSPPSSLRARGRRAGRGRRRGGRLVRRGHARGVARVRPRGRRDHGARRARRRRATPPRCARSSTDFEGREEHLTGVPVADTALMLERLAEPRGLAAHPASALLPAS